MPDYLDNAVRSFPEWQLSGYPIPSELLFRQQLNQRRNMQGVQSNSGGDQQDEAEAGFGFIFAGSSKRPHLRPFRVIYPPDVITVPED
ncbi:hypothetical protein BRC19_01205 [Candidatus Saccharibacteria bacterium QS_5_54_17]|nr:MAG: hypothetical protein BRC19_01205 [Candidatus Saccharibacteria bacterium QS_5_54_17]